MITKIHSATVIVADQDTALDFYVNTLGWEKRQDAEVGPGYRFLTVAPAGGDAELVLTRRMRPIAGRAATPASR